MSRKSTLDLAVISTALLVVLCWTGLSVAQLPTDLTTRMLERNTPAKGWVPNTTANVVQVGGIPEIFATQVAATERDDVRCPACPANAQCDRCPAKAESPVFQVKGGCDRPECDDCPRECPDCKDVCPDCLDKCPADAEGPVVWATNDSGLQLNRHGFIKNTHAMLPSFHVCEELAQTMSSCLADPNIDPESRRKILESSMKLLVRNAELEAQAEVARMRLEHEREMAVLRGNLLQMQTQMSVAGDVKNWMGPIYTNQSQTQQQINSLMTNLQLINRTLRLLEKEKESNYRLQTNQPLPSRLVPPSAQPRPERWSQLPSHSAPQRTTPADDRTTHSQPSPKSDAILSSSTTRMVPPPRLTDEQVRRQQLNRQIQIMQAELNQRNAQSIRPVGWNQEVPSSQTPLPSRQLQPRK